MGDVLLIFHIRKARQKARPVASAEALAVLNGLGANVLDGGPLGDQRGVFWITLKEHRLDEAVGCLPRLGYTDAVDLAQLAVHNGWKNSDERCVQWRKHWYKLTRIYEENVDVARDQAPDRRHFLLETSSGEVRSVQGYRGDGSALGKRGLPVYDARMLVNLVSPDEGKLFLDPFAGIGGIILEAVNGGHVALSCDCDPILRFGVTQLGARHSVADAVRLPFGSNTIDAIATEPPYDRDSETSVLGALVEMARVLKPSRKLAVLCADWQAERLRHTREKLGLICLLEHPIDRKGTNCAVLVWQKNNL